MSFWGDERAVSTVVGAVLVFAILILALGTYQSQIVPAQNERVEYEHSQTIGNQLQDLRNALVGTAATGNPRPASVTLGVRYPSRTFTVNPPPPDGRLQGVAFENRSNVTVANVRAVNPETADYLTGSLNFSTDGIEYIPDYNEFRNAPTTRYEHGMLYDAYENGDIERTGGIVVEDRTITLVTLNVSEDFRESGVDSVSVDPQALSAPYHSTRVTNASGNITLTLPTKANASMWQEVYEDRSGVSVTPNGSAVDITLDNGTYDLRMAHLGVGREMETPGAEYLTLVRGNGTDEVTVEVRDKYNNPVSGVDVTAGSGSFEESTVESDSNGETTFVYTGETNQDVTFSINGGGTDETEVTTTVTWSDSGTTGPGGGNSFNIFWNATLSNASDLTCYADSDTCYTADTQVDLIADTSPTESGAPVDFSANNTDIDFTGSDARTNGTGDATAAFDASALDTQNDNRWVSAYVTSVGNGDKVRVYVNNRPTADFSFTPLEPEPGDTITFNASDSTDPDGDALTYEWDWTSDGTVDSTTSSSTQTHTYSSEGNYTVTLTVSDGNGGEATTTRNVNVTTRPSAEHVSLVGGSPATFGGSNTGVAFQVNNTGDPATVSAITINSTGDKQATQVAESNTGTTPTRTNREVYINTSTDGVLDMDGTPYDTDSGTALQLGDRTSMTEDGTIDTGGSATVNMYAFRKPNGNTRNMNGDSVTVTLHFADGSQKTFTFTA